MWRAFVCAVGFLTRIPVPRLELYEADVARSAGFFAWVGWIIALLLEGSSVALATFGSRITALVLVALWAFVTRGLHLDGLADTVDGLSGGRGDRERTLEIMRDSRIGSHGATALMLLLALKWAALERVVDLGHTTWLVVPVIARLVSTVFLASFPYARERGLGSAFAGRVGPRELIVGGLALIPCVALAEGRFVVPALVGAGVALALAFRVKRLLGGLTGDVHGAAIEVCEVGMLLVMIY